MVRCLPTTRKASSACHADVIGLYYDSNIYYSVAVLLIIIILIHPSVSQRERKGKRKGLASDLRLTLLQLFYLQTFH
jgi:hypothetical protein